MKGGHDKRRSFEDIWLGRKVSDDDFLMRVERKIDRSVFEGPLSRDYAPTESFFNSLKNEQIQGVYFRTHEEACAEIF